MIITILKRRWRVLRPRQITCDGEPQHGDCDSPDRPNKAIRIIKSLRDRVELETFLHEMLHASDWSKDESWVEEVAHDISQSLWRLGYRRIEDANE